MTSTPHIIDALHALDEGHMTVDPDGPHAPDWTPLDERVEDEAPARRQAGQLIEVLVEGSAPYTVRVGNRELIAYEKTAARHREWPQPTRDAPELGRYFQMTFCTFVAAKRAGRFKGTFESWCEVLEDWDVVKDVPADPTR